MYETKYGSKYDEVKSLTTTEIAKRIRADIKAALDNGCLPMAKYSVRTEYFSGGSSIHVHVKELTFCPYTQAYLDADKAAWRGFNDTTYVGAWLQAKKAVERIVAAYNYDGSEPMIDYFHVNFYSSVDLDHDWLWSVKGWRF
jgi:hypothetical protein